MFWVVVVAGVAFLALWARRPPSESHAGSASLKDALQTLATNPSEFVRSRITGGVGVMLTVDRPGGGSLPTVVEIKAGSPAERAGLRAGDVITQVNGATTTGQKLADVVEAIRGFSMGSVAITVLRGQTNDTRLEFVIRRDSMNSLLQLTNGTQ